MATATVRLIDADAVRERRASEAKRRVESHWYYAKKAVPVFPGVDRAFAPTFLQDYYQRWETGLTRSRKLLNRAILAGFRAWVPGRARQIAKRYGLDENWQLTAARRASDFIIDPRELALFRIGSDTELDNYLRSFEWARIARIINPQYWTPDCRVAHKIDFYLHAMAHGLPIPALRAVVQDGTVTLLESAEGNRLVCKPENGQGGRAVFILDLPQEVRGDGAALAELLASDPRLRKGDWVVQDHVAVNADLADLAMSALPTIRLITMPNEAGEPEILVTYLRFPSDPAVEVDNFAAGGLMGLIDGETGVMRYAVIKRDLADHSVHPVSGKPISGVPIPFWRETCDLVRTAHGQAFADYRMIGWDIGVTETGPVIIEGNAKPCPQGAQQVQRHGLGETRFGELIAWHLAQCETAP